jgi:signal transduction histidine kinase
LEPLVLTAHDPQASAPLSKILLVDDQPANLLALNAALKGCGYELIEASSGREAIDLVRSNDFAVILLDVQMPDMDGFETAYLLRLQPKARSTPIIFVTAHNRTERLEHKGYIAGAVDYLFKPINVEILKAKLAVFSELHQQKQENHRQAELLKERAVKEKENELLKEALKVRDEFLSMAAHELKTPITPLNLQMQTFLKMLGDGTFHDIEPERLMRMLKTSNDQLQRLCRLIDELLDVTRISAGKLELKKEDVDLGLLVRLILQGFAEQFQSAGCPLETEIQPRIRGSWDKFRVEQAIVNLISNAIKYGECKPIKVSVFSEDGLAVIKVKDSGIGIDKSDQQRIFQRFERAASSQHHSGLGLGLYIANQVALRHDGSIKVVSERGHGAEFTLRLPTDQNRLS